MLGGLVEEDGVVHPPLTTVPPGWVRFHVHVTSSVSVPTGALDMTAMSSVVRNGASLVVKLTGLVITRLWAVRLAWVQPPAARLIVRGGRNSERGAPPLLGKSTVTPGISTAAPASLPVSDRSS